jgi:predicted nucleic-acid-binding protein
LLQKVKKKELEIEISESVIVEIVQFLSSKALYNLPKAEIQKRIFSVLILENLRLENKKVYIQAFNLYSQHNLDFTDCLLAAKTGQTKYAGLYSYDKDFNKIPGRIRLTP